jgi:hypothetical protein
VIVLDAEENNPRVWITNRLAEADISEKDVQQLLTEHLFAIYPPAEPTLDVSVVQGME